MKPNYSGRFYESNALLGNGGINVEEYKRRLEQIVVDSIGLKPKPVEVVAK